MASRRDLTWSDWPGEQGGVLRLGHRWVLKGHTRASCRAGVAAQSTLACLKNPILRVFFQCSLHSGVKFGICESSERLCIGLECYISSILTLMQVGPCFTTFKLNSVCVYICVDVCI